MASRGRRALTVAAVVLGAVAAVTTNLATDRKTNLWAWLVVVVVTVLAALVALWLDHPSEQTLPQIADVLASAVSDQWNGEATRRGLYNPYALSVRWHPSEPDLVADWPSVVSDCK
ncbi:MAG: hypothetical protein M3Y48_10435 [Actinomycetota bacterium]|nr:hypothetical protein [Actinomycetota bacterium]